jgi:hypothetical protein
MESIGVIDSVARNALIHRCFSSPHFLATFLLRRTSHNKTSNGHQHKKMERVMHRDTAIWCVPTGVMIVTHFHLAGVRPRSAVAQSPAAEGNFGQSCVPRCRSWVVIGLGRRRRSKHVPKWSGRGDSSQMVPIPLSLWKCRRCQEGEVTG